MARASLLHYHQSFADPNFFDRNLQQLQPAAIARQDTTARSQLLGSCYQTQSMAQPYTQQYSSAGGSAYRQWHQYQAYMQSGGAQAGQPSLTTTPRDHLSIEGAALDDGFTFSSRPHLLHDLPQLDGSSYANGSLAYPESASRLDTHISGAASWPTPRSFEHSGSTINDAFDRGTNDSQSPMSYNSETQPSNAQPFTPKSIPSAASNRGDWSCGSAQSYTAIKASSPIATPWSIEHDGRLHLMDPSQHGSSMTVPMAPSIGSCQDFIGLPAAYSGTSQHGSDYSYSQHSSPEISPGFYGGPSYGSTLMSHQSNDLLSCGTPCHGLPNPLQQTSNGTSAVPTFRGGSYKNVPKRDNGQALSDPETGADYHARRRADDAILLEGKRNGLTYRDISKKMHKKCAESTLRGRYRSLTKAREHRVRKPVWREKDIKLLTEYVTRDLNRIDASFNQSLTNDQRLAKVQWKKIADAILSHGGSYHFGNSTCKRKWVELHPKP